MRHALTVGKYVTVGGQERQPFLASLSDKQAVERVLMHRSAAARTCSPSTATSPMPARRACARTALGSTWKSARPSWSSMTVSTG